MRNEDMVSSNIEVRREDFCCMCLELRFSLREKKDTIPATGGKTSKTSKVIL
jgi:hypothetical protein